MNFPTFHNFDKLYYYYSNKHDKLISRHAWVTYLENSLRLKFHPVLNTFGTVYRVFGSQVRSILVIFTCFYLENNFLLESVTSIASIYELRLVEYLLLVYIPAAPSGSVLISISEKWQRNNKNT